MRMIGPGPIAVTLRDRGGQVFNVAAYDSVADAAAAVEATGGILSFPPGGWTLPRTGLVFTRAIQIAGAGMGATELVVPADMPATTDAIRYAPALGGSQSQGFAVRDLTIRAAGGAPARHGIAIDVSSGGVLRFARQLTVERCWIGMPGTEFGGRAFEVINATPTTEGPSLFCSRIRDCQIYGGIRLVGAGDSIAIRDNAISGANCGIEADLVPGATLLLIDGNNITSTGGAIWLKGCNHPVIRHNNIEQVAEFVGGSGNRACIDLDGGAIQRLALAEVVSNHIGLLSGIAGAGVRANRCDDPQIARNTFTLAALGARGIQRTLSAVGVATGGNRVVGGLGILE